MCMHHTGTELAQRTVKCELNVQYDDPEGPTLDIYYPPDGQGEGSSSPVLPSQPVSHPPLFWRVRDGLAR